MLVPHDLCILQDFGTYMAESSQFAFYW